jgi:hypothetical protein
VAARILGLATGTHPRQLRGLADPLTALEARLQDADLRARLALPPSPRNALATSPQPRPVRSRFIHHVWMMDLSEVKQFP